MPLKDPAARRNYQRVLMQRRALFARMKPRLQRHMDDRGFVWIRTLHNCRLWGAQFMPGEVHRVHWKIAARLIGGALAEPVKTPEVDQQEAEESDAL